jgi:type II secretory pathway pseudopilin PulG
MEMPPQVPPLQPIAELAPRSNRALFARVLIAALLIGVLAVGAIWLIRTLGDGDDNRDNAAAEQTATRAAEIAQIAAIQGTQTATAVVAASQPTATATVPEPTATDEPAQPTATEKPAEPTKTPEQEAASDEGDNQASSDGGGGGAQAPIKEMLPTLEDIPDGFEQSDDGKLSKTDVAESFTNSDDAAQKLDEWEWKDNVYRIFELSADREHAPEDVTYLYVSIHRFGSAEAAGAALPYFAGEVQNARNLAPIDTDKQLGDQMIAVAGGAAGSNEVGLYIRDGARVIRVTAFSESGDALDDALALAEKVLNK